MGENEVYEIEKDTAGLEVKHETVGKGGLVAFVT